MASYQGQGFIPLTTSHTFPLTYPLHSLLSCSILFACLTSKPLFFKHSTVSIHPFLGLPTERLPAHTPTYSWQSYHSPYGLTTMPLSSPYTPHNSLIHAFGTLCILLIPSNPLRLSICTALNLDLSSVIYLFIYLYIY